MMTRFFFFFSNVKRDYVSLNQHMTHAPDKQGYIYNGIHHDTISIIVEKHNYK